MQIGKLIDNFNASLITKNYAQADKFLKKVVKEKLRIKFDNEYRKVERSFFTK
jgi:hypothetical protein